MEPTFSPAKAIPQFNCTQRSRLPIGLLLLTLALFLTRQAAADIISFPAVTIPQTITAEPGNDCPANYQDCSGEAEGSFTAMAQNGAPLFGISSSYEFAYVAPGGEGAGDLILSADGTFMGLVYKDSQLIPPTVGDTVGPSSSFQDFPYPDTVLKDYYFPFGGQDIVYPFYEYGAGLEQPVYMGYEFQAAGQTYYGWFSFSWNARFDFLGDRFTDPPTISLGTYAYEACPNAPIAIGAASGGAACSDPLAPTPEPCSLTLYLIGAGLLALALRVRSDGQSKFSLQPQTADLKRGGLRYLLLADSSQMPE